MMHCPINIRLTVLICDIDYTHNVAAGEVAGTSRQPYNTTLSTVNNYLEVKLVLFMPGRHGGGGGGLLA